MKYISTARRHRNEELPQDAWHSSEYRKIILQNIEGYKWTEL